QGLYDRRRTIARQPDVVLVGGSFVRVALDLDERDVRIADQRRSDRIDDREAPRQDLRAVRLEVDLLEDDDRVLFDDDASGVRAAVFVLGAVVRLGLVRTGVVDVEDAIRV